MALSKKKTDPFTYDVYGATDSGGGATAPASPAPAPIARPFAERAFDASAKIGDAVASVPTGIADATSRVGYGVRNFVATGLGAAPIQAPTYDYNPVSNTLGRIRSANAQSAAAPVANPAAGGAGSTGAKVNFITADNPASLKLSPPNRGNPVSPAGATHVPGGTAPAGGGTPVGAGEDRVLGTFNGRTITQSQADALAAKLPTASGPVAFGPNGSYVAATGGTAAAPIAQPTANAAPQAPGLVLPSVDTSRIRAADEARMAQVSALRDQLSRIGPLNMRSKRDLAATLQAQISQLTGGAGELAQSGVNNELDANTRLQAQQLGDATTLTATNLSQEGENQRALLAQQGENARTSATLTRPSQITAADGSVYTLSGDGSSVAPLKMPDGSTFKSAMTDRSGAITPKDVLSSLTDQLKAEQSAIQPNPDTISNLQQQISAMTSGANGVSGAASKAPPTAAEFIKAMRARGSKMSDADLTAYYSANYGK